MIFMMLGLMVPLARCNAQLNFLQQKFCTQAVNDAMSVCICCVTFLKLSLLCISCTSQYCIYLALHFVHFLHQCANGTMYVCLCIRKSEISILHSARRCSFQ